MTERFCKKCNKCATVHKQAVKMNAPTVSVMVEKKILLMKAAVSSLTTRENANHVNK